MSCVRGLFCFFGKICRPLRSIRYGATRRLVTTAVRFEIDDVPDDRVLVGQVYLDHGRGAGSSPFDEAHPPSSHRRTKPTTDRDAFGITYRNPNPVLHTYRPGPAITLVVRSANPNDAIHANSTDRSHVAASRPNGTHGQPGTSSTRTRGTARIESRKMRRSRECTRMVSAPQQRTEERGSALHPSTGLRFELRKPYPVLRLQS